MMDGSIETQLCSIVAAAAAAVAAALEAVGAAGAEKAAKKQNRWALVQQKTPSDWREAPNRGYPAEPTAACQKRRWS